MNFLEKKNKIYKIYKIQKKFTIKKNKKIGKLI